MSIDGLPIERRLVTPNEEIASIRRRLLGLESKGTKIGKMRWRNHWEPSYFTPHDVVKDGDWTMVANKPTTDRAAPQPTGPLTWLFTTPTSWDSQPSSVNVIQSGFRLRPTEAFAIEQFRVWLPNVTADAKYRTIVKNNLTGRFDMSQEVVGTILGAPGWLTVPIEPSFVIPGSDLSFLLIAEVSSATTDYNHPWVYAGSSQNGAPGLGEVNRDNQQLTLRINNTDDDSTDRTAELDQAEVAGTVVRVASEGDLTAYYEYTVSSGFDDGAFHQYAVTPIETGPGGAPSGRCQVYFEVPIPLSTDYVEKTDYWAAYPEVDGLLQIGDGPLVESHEGYGFDIEFQKYTASADWDLLATSGGIGGGGGGGAEYLNDLFDVNAPAPGDGQRLTWDEPTNQWIPRRSTSALGMIAFPYRFGTTVDDTPTSGHVQFDNADQTLATIVYIHEEDDPGDDLTLFLENLEVGDWLNIHDRDDVVARHVSYDVVEPGPSYVSPTWHIPVTLFESVGAPLSNNMQIAVLFRFGQGAGVPGGHVVSVNEPATPETGLVWVDPDAPGGEDYDTTYLRLDGSNVPMTGALGLPLGTEGLPALYFDVPGTGIYVGEGGNYFGFSIIGGDVFSASTSHFVVGEFDKPGTARMAAFPSGASNPAYSFQTYSGLGMYAGASDKIYFSVPGNAVRLAITPTYTQVGNQASAGAPRMHAFPSTTLMAYGFQDSPKVGLKLSNAGNPALYLDGAVSNLYEFGGDRLLPYSDNTKYLGDSARRWIRLYAALTSVIGSRAEDKSNLREMPDSGALVDALAPQLWERDGETAAGFTVEQWLGVERLDGWTPVDPEEVGLAYTSLIAPLWNEVRALRLRVAELEGS